VTCVAGDLGADVPGRASRLSARRAVAL